MNNNEKLKLTAEEFEKAVKLFNQGLSYTKIGKELGIDRHRLARELKENGYINSMSKTNNNQSVKTIQEKEDLYQQWYNSGESLKVFANNTPHTSKTLGRWFNELGYKINRNNAKPINESYFDILNEDNVYWIGFLLADGHIAKDNCHFELSLKDKEHVEKFRDSLSSTCKVSKREVKSNGAIVYRINIGNKHIVSELAKYGVVNNKTELVITVPNNIPDNLLRHYFRGFFEGDGGFHKDCKDQVNGITFTSNYEESLINLGDKLKELLGINYTIRSKTDHAPQLLMWGYNMRTFLNWIYADNPKLYLDRKYKDYNDYFAVWNTKVSK